MTYLEICNRLCAAGIENAEWDAALLIAHFCDETRDRILSEPTRDFRNASLEEAVERRAAHYPLQYLLGEWDFYRQTYEVSPDCLIPRSDTEILVEEAIRILPPNALFADLCTGSGCIAVSVLAERSDTRAVAVEKFLPTLQLAERNAARNRVSDRFTPICADLFEDAFLPSGVLFDAILSNPPYIRRSVLDELEPELFAEPRAALDGGADGLCFYRRILHSCRAFLKPQGVILLEIGFDQADAIRALAAENGFSDCRILRDYGGCDRVAILKCDE